MFKNILLATALATTFATAALAQDGSPTGGNLAPGSETLTKPNGGEAHGRMGDGSHMRRHMHHRHWRRHHHHHHHHDGM